MQLGLIGLGKMGGNMRERVRRAGHEVVGYDTNPEVSDVESVQAMVEALQTDFWVRFQRLRPHLERTEGGITSLCAGQASHIHHHRAPHAADAALEGIMGALRVLCRQLGLGLFATDLHGLGIRLRHVDGLLGDHKSCAHFLRG